MDGRLLIQFLLQCASLATFNVASGFVLQGKPTCVVSAPCECRSDSWVGCVNKGIRNIPNVLNISHTGPTVTVRINLSQNNITSVPAKAFSNIDGWIDIVLSNNKIARIDQNAFFGVETQIITLFLDGNELHSLPSAIGGLRNPEHLYLQGNPLSDLDISVMSQLGLERLEVDMSDFMSWPVALSKLRFLNNLVITYFPFSHLPINSFTRIDSTINQIDILSSNLLTVPTEICHLYNLTVLQIKNSPLLSNGSMSCSQRLPKLSFLVLRNDSLVTFPDVLNTFPSVSRMDLSFNKIIFIPAHFIPSTSVLTYLDLNSNQLTRVPAALNKLQYLDTLYINNNNIITVEDYDLIGLSNLKTVTFASNPIRYVAQNAFVNNTALSYIDFDNTCLSRVPETMRHLPNLYTTWSKAATCLG